MKTGARGIFLRPPNALTEGLTIESGCSGPELGIGMLSGILVCLYLRFFSSVSNS